MKRPYECKYHDCDKKFTTRFSLRRHISTHAPAKQYICVICNKKFALGQYLKEHTYIHTGQKPFKCPYEGCNKAFRQAGKLSLHKKLHQNKIFIVQKVKRSSSSLSNEESCCSSIHETSMATSVSSGCNEVRAKRTLSLVVKTNSEKSLPTNEASMEFINNSQCSSTLINVRLPTIACVLPKPSAMQIPVKLPSIA